MEFVSWSILGTYAGALAMVITVTQFTKEIKIIKKIPTQIWSYMISLAVLYPAYFFCGNLDISNAVLILFNGIIVALAANGGFDALSNAFPSLFSNMK